LSPEGLAQRELELDGVDAMGVNPYLDKVGSVSALIEPPEPLFVDVILEEQNRRFFHGS